MQSWFLIVFYLMANRSSSTLRTWLVPLAAIKENGGTQVTRQFTPDAITDNYASSL